MNRFLSSCLVVTSLSTLCAVNALAQTVPSAAQPGRTDNIRSLELRPDVTREPLLKMQDDAKGVQALKGGKTFILRNIEVQNVTVIAPAEIESIYQPYIGGKTSLATLNEIAAKITAQYRNAGYILSRAVVVPQHIRDGKVTMRVVEGFVDQVIFQGNKVDSDFLNAYAAKIKASKPLNSAVLERYLLLMEDLPGVNARATLRPSANVSGASDVIITLDEKPVNLRLTADNRGTRFMGQGQASATVAVNNMIPGLYEKTQVRYLNSGPRVNDMRELHYGEIRHEENLGYDGTKGALSAAYTRSDAGHTIANLNNIGRDTLLTAEVTHPFVRSRQENVYGTLQYNHRNTEVDRLGARAYEDILNVVRAEASYDFVDAASGVNRIDGKLSKGFGWDDNSDNGIRSRAVGETSFVKANAEISRLQPLFDAVSLVISGTGQASNASLLSSEQFGVGGASYGSAYDPSEITGDSGVAGRAEMQYARYNDSEYIPSYQTYGFYDVGQVWTRRPGVGQNKRESLASTGIGLRFNTSADVSGGVELAFPLTQRVSANGGDGHAPRVFFNLGYQY